GAVRRHHVFPKAPDVCPVRVDHGQDERLLRGEAMREAALVDPGLRANLVHTDRRIATDVHECHRRGDEARLRVAGASHNKLAPFLTLCSASNLAEARCIPSPWQGLSPAKTCASSRRSRAPAPDVTPDALANNL